jgi:hypothetical protein
MTIFCSCTIKIRHTFQKVYQKLQLDLYNNQYQTQKRTIRLDGGNRLMTEERNQRAHSVAITCAGSGLGRELALGFSVKGYQVFGTAL